MWCEKSLWMWAEVSLCVSTKPCEGGTGRTWGEKGPLPIAGLLREGSEEATVSKFQTWMFRSL